MVFGKKMDLTSHHVTAGIFENFEIFKTYVWCLPTRWCNSYNSYHSNDTAVVTQLKNEEEEEEAEEHN